MPLLPGPRNDRVPVRLQQLRRENVLLRRAVVGTSVRHLADALLQVIDGVLPGCPCEILVRAGAAGYLEVVGTRGFRADRGRGCRIPLGMGVTGVAGKSGSPIWVRDVTRDPRYIPGVGGARWELAIPLRHRDDTLGVVDLESGGPKPTLGQRRYLGRLAELLAPAFDRALASRHVAPLQIRSRARSAGATEATAAPPGTPPLQPDAAAVRFQPIHDLIEQRVIGYEAEVGRALGAREAAGGHGASAQAAGEDLARLRAVLAAWRRDRGLLFVDIHPLALDRSGFAGEVQGLLRQYGMPPTSLVLELPNPGKTGPLHRALLAAQSDHHLAVALDGFGAGAGDAQALIELRPAYVKLDRVLVRGVERDFGRRTYIESLAYYTRRMGTYLIALEIATPAEMSALRRAGVTYGQGELLGPAGPLLA